MTAAAGLRELAGRLERGSGPLLLTAGDLQIPTAGLGELTGDPRPVTRFLRAEFRVRENGRRARIIAWGYAFRITSR